MGFFFSNGSKNERGFRFGGTTNITDSNGDSDFLVNAGDFVTGKNGNMINNGDLSYLSNGSVITRSGNCYYCNGKMYNRSGNTLYGPDGNFWSGNNMTDADIRNIIFHDNP